jgi:Flp pilus assembly protein TadD
MGELLKLPVEASRFGYQRVRKRARRGEDPAQLDLFAPGTPQILEFRPELGWFEQALWFDERGDDRAAGLYRKAIDEGDCVADAWCNLGILESQQGNTAQAFDCFTKALREDPRHAEAHFNLGNLYFELNDFKLAQVHYELATELDPELANAHFNLALVHAIHDDLPAAARALGRYRELVPEDEWRTAEDLLRRLIKSLGTSRGKRTGTP